MFTICPAPWGSICRSACLQHKKVPVSVVARVAFQSSAASSAAGATRRRRRRSLQHIKPPEHATARSIRWSTCASSVTSVGTASARCPAWRSRRRLLDRIRCARRQHGVARLGEHARHLQSNPTAGPGDHRRVSSLQHAALFRYRLGGAAPISCRQVRPQPTCSTCTSFSRRWTSSGRHSSVPGVITAAAPAACAPAERLFQRLARLSEASSRPPSSRRRPRLIGSTWGRAPAARVVQWPPRRLFAQREDRSRRLAREARRRPDVILQVARSLAHQFGHPILVRLDENGRASTPRRSGRRRRRAACEPGRETRSPGSRRSRRALRRGRLPPRMRNGAGIASRRW